MYEFPGVTARLFYGTVSTHERVVITNSAEVNAPSLNLPAKIVWRTGSAAFALFCLKWLFGPGNELREQFLHSPASTCAPVLTILLPP